MTIIWPSNTKDIIDQIRGAIGRDVTFCIIESQTYCPVCAIDPATNESIDPFCPTCSGIGYIYTYSGVTVSGHVTWNTHDQLNWTSGGQLFDGDCRVQIEYTPENVTIIDTAKWVEVDNKKLEIKKRTYRGVQQLNRILVDLIEREK